MDPLLEEWLKREKSWVLWIDFEERFLEFKSVEIKSWDCGWLRLRLLSSVNNSELREDKDIVFRFWFAFSLNVVACDVVECWLLDDDVLVSFFIWLVSFFWIDKDCGVEKSNSLSWDSESEMITSNLRFFDVGIDSGCE